MDGNISNVNHLKLKLKRELKNINENYIEQNMKILILKYSETIKKYKIRILLNKFLCTSKIVFTIDEKLIFKSAFFVLALNLKLF